ncbi:Alpha-1 3(6)-mannosylglycoprotein beta-1 6-N-acetyl-glucosaminyltransferase [Fasciolopsis buskii]|uniref:alpha-1,6-mannosyl-glycoprotein 6-beta-N-acetylglucosaminyltransferase n=1 Tax=Fasciolopsis buskii TaxID=27845 RepID=A0A8E0RY68_9TREM|nr:Alpha-1 3(6)-mannosylglycoprotein beta-1 6-N-acetyl-glucosaminyltransferase [Fasciolopsis buski]
MDAISPPPLPPPFTCPDTNAIYVALLRGAQEGCVVDAQKLLSFPECESKVQWLRKRWNSNPCYSALGIDGTDCSLVRYLGEVENFCPFTEDRLKYSNRPIAQIQYGLEGLLASLSPEEKHANSYMFIRSRLTRMWPQWIDGMRRYASWNEADDKVTIVPPRHHALPTGPNPAYQPGQPHFFNRTRLNVHLHLSFISFLSSALFEESIGKGGPLGELVQWTDLLAGLYILGHNVSISVEPLTLFNRHFNFTPRTKPECQTEQNVFDLLFTDIIGYRQLRRLGVRIPKCKYRILDSFGTEALFNWQKKNSTWGGLQMNLKQFYTMFPHSPDNTFLGFAIESVANSTTSKVNRNEYNDTARSLSDKPIALVYGKAAYMWQDALPYLTVLNESFEVHSNVMDTQLSPQFNFVVSHHCPHGAEFLRLMRSAKVFVGLGFPYEGPAPLEAIANGVVFLNPRFRTPHGRNNTSFFSDKPTSRKLTSQHPYLEQHIGEPYTYTVELDDPDQIRQVVKRILNRSEITPYVPFEYTTTGYLERLNALVTRQSFCTGPERLKLLRTPWKLDLAGSVEKQYLELDANIVQWPPIGPGGVRFIVGPGNASCMDACAATRPRDGDNWLNSSYLHKRSVGYSGFLSSQTGGFMSCASEHFTSANQYTLMESILPPGTRCELIESSTDSAAPYWDSADKVCMLQADRLLFDCIAKSTKSRVQRVCPCQINLPGQTAMCVGCV